MIKKEDQAERKLMSYYDSFMQDHFLYDNQKNEASRGLKQRLQKVQMEIARSA